MYWSWSSWDLGPPGFYPNSGSGVGSGGLEPGKTKSQDAQVLSCRWEDCIVLGQSRGHWEAGCLGSILSPRAWWGWGLVG